MSSVHRIIKRLVIIFSYLVIFSVIAGFFYYTFRAKPTCTDKVQNQGETGVDCGHPCAECEEIPDIEEIRILEKAILSGESGKFDALAKIENPNSQFGAANVSYSFSLLGEDGKIISKNEGKTFILPAETKYVLAFNMQSDAKPASLDFKISSSQWTQ